jgi:hypothetical protein
VNRSPLMLYAIPGVLAVLGLAVPLAASGGTFWPFTVGWFTATIAVVALSATVGSSRFGRLVLALTVVFACAVLAFEGGFFLLPTALALLVIEARSFVQSPSGMRFARW